jgi:hypothetical protein
MVLSFPIHNGFATIGNEFFKEFSNMDKSYKMNDQ